MKKTKTCSNKIMIIKKSFVSIIKIITTSDLKQGSGINHSLGERKLLKIERKNIASGILKSQSEDDGRQRSSASWNEKEEYFVTS